MQRSMTVPLADPRRSSSCPARPASIVRDRLVAPARARLREHDAGRLGDPHRVLRRDGDRAARRAAGSPTGSRSPLRLYGVLELVLVVVVLVTPLTFRLIDDAVPRASTRRSRARRWLLALVASRPRGPGARTGDDHDGRDAPGPVPPPQRDRRSSSSAFGRLYAANTLGAIVGTLVAGLVLIELLGLTGALARRRGVLGDRRASRPCWLAPRRSRPRRRRSRRSPIGRDVAADQVGRPPRLPLVGRLRLRPDVARLPGDVDAAARLGDRQHDLRLHVILALFLIGLALGALLFNASARGSAIRSASSPGSQIAVAVLAMAGLVAGHRRSRASSTRAGRSVDSAALLGPAIAGRPAGHRRAGARLPGRIGAAAGRRGRTPVRDPGSLLAVNTVGAILGSLVIPFVLIPTLGSPLIVALLALANVGARDRPRAAARGGRRGPTGRGRARGRRRDRRDRRSRPGCSSSRTRRSSPPAAAALRVDRGRDRLGPGRPDRLRRRSCGSAGTSMTLLTVDAKLMPILPLIARPGVRRARWSSRSGWAPRSGRADRRPADRRRRARPVRAEDVRLLLPGRRRGPRRPERPGDHRRRPEPPRADRRALRHHRHRPAAADRELRRRRSSRRSSTTRPGRDHLTDGGDHDAVDAVRRDRRSTSRSTSGRSPRCSREVTVVRGAGGYGVYMLGSSAADRASTEADIRAVLARPGVLDGHLGGVRLAGHDRRRLGRRRSTARPGWPATQVADTTPAPGPLITDDRPAAGVLPAATGCPALAGG